MGGRFGAEYAAAKLKPIASAKIGQNTPESSPLRRTKVLPKASQSGRTTTVKKLLPGDVVRAADRNNVGTIQSVDETSKIAQVSFYNRKTSAKETVNLPLNVLTIKKRPMVKQGTTITPKAEMPEPVQKILSAIKAAKPIRGNQEALYSTERARRAARVAAMGAKVPGEAGYHAQLGQLKGELPKATYEGVRDKVTQGDVDALFDIIETYPTLDPFQKISAKGGLNKLLGEIGGSVPTKSDLSLLGQIFGKEFVDIIMKKRSVMSKAVGRVGTLQTMAQLLNPKTTIRNVGGNTIFGGLENLSQTLATPLDKTVALVTGKRTTTLPSIKTQLKGAKTGLLQGAKESWAGTNTGAATQYELNDVPEFRGRILGSLEKIMNVSLRAPDRAAFNAAFDDSIRGSLKLAKTDVVTPEMIEQATHAGLYRTFQDKNVISNFFVGMKNTLNRVGLKDENGKAWGLGDLILKYPKTPGNLLARGIDYSPAGFIKTLFEVTKPLAGKEFNQKAFIDSIARASTGTSLLGTAGYVLGALGIITALPSKDKDVRGLQKTVGQGAYQINVSALKRFVLTGLNKDAAKLREGDTLVSYDWAQPVSIPVTAAANIATKRNAQQSASAIVDSIAGGVETLAEQPLLTGLQRFFGGQDPMKSLIADPLKSLPASFTPTILNQIKQLTDNTSRNTYSADPAEQSLNMVKNRIPGLASTLPERRTIFGDTQEMYQDGTNNPLNVFFNPAFVSKYKPTPAATEILRLVESTGETKQIPRVVANSIKRSGETLDLTGAQVAKYQKLAGERSQQMMDYLISNPQYQALSDEDKVKLIQSALTEINSGAKAIILADTTTVKTMKESVKKYVEEFENNGGSQKTLAKKLEALHPLAGMEREEALAYLKTLNKKQGKQLLESVEYYEQTIQPVLGMMGE